MKKLDMMFIGSSALLVIYWVAVLALPEMSSPLNALYFLMLDVATLMGYPGVVLVSFLGNAIILFPLPYMGVAFILGGITDSSSLYFFDPWVIGILGGFGAAIGELTGYIIGYAGNRFVDEEQTSGFLKIIEEHPRATPLVLWFLAATPIPDDVVIIPLGVARYPFWKVFIPQFIGKAMFLTAVAWAGRWSLQWIETLLVGNPTSPVSKSIEVVALLLVLVAIYLVLKFDWNRSDR
ncbi:MAG: VTT domain-containing protein [Candidatus Thorarchaeota archaeon]